MQKRRNFFLVSLVLISLSLVILSLSISGFLNPVSSITQTIFSPIQKTFFGIYAGISGLSTNQQLDSLKKQNLILSQKLVDQTKIIADNKALSDQFKNTNTQSQKLIAADIVGSPSFIPGISAPKELILNRGSVDGIKIGQAVLSENNLIGKISNISDFNSVAILVSNSGFSTTAKTLTTDSSGVVKGQGGGEIILDNVLLSDNLKKDDLVLTKGDVNSSGIGIAPDLVIGKIKSVSKNPSDLFQKAEIESLIDLTKLTKIFILQNN